MNDFAAKHPVCHIHHTQNVWYVQGIGWTCSACRKDGIEYKVLTRNEARRILFDAPVVETDQTRWCANKNCDGPFIPKVTPTEKNRQLYCSLTCKRAAKAHRQAEREASKVSHDLMQKSTVGPYRITNGDDVYMIPDNILDNKTQWEVIKTATNDTDAEVEFGRLRTRVFTSAQILKIWNDHYNFRRKEAVEKLLNTLGGETVDRVIVDEIHAFTCDDPAWQVFNEGMKKWDDYLIALSSKRNPRRKQLSAEQHQRLTELVNKDVKHMVEFATNFCDRKFEAWQLLVIHDYFYNLHRQEAGL